MPTYAFRDERGELVLSAPEFAKPIPVHAQTPEARAAVEAMRRYGHERRLGAVVQSLVTEHGRPHVQPYTGGVPTAAKRVEKAASAAGFETMTREDGETTIVEGLHRGRRVGFRAYWKRGRAIGGTWHSGGRDVWRLVDISDRPIGVDARTKTTKVGCRHDENDRTRLVLVESPRGIPYNITELTERIGQP